MSGAGGFGELLLPLAVLYVVPLVPAVLYLALLQRALSDCSPELRRIPPPLVWLQLVPLIGTFWQFTQVIAVSESLGDELRARRIPADPKPAEGVGLVMATFGVLAWIPEAGRMFALVALACWIACRVRIARAHRLLRRAPAVRPVPAPH